MRPLRPSVLIALLASWLWVPVLATEVPQDLVARDVTAFVVDETRGARSPSVSTAGSTAPATRGDRPRGARGGLWPLLRFCILLEVLGLAGFGLLRRWAPGPGAYALGKVLGPLIFFYVSWLLVELRLASFTHLSLALALCGVLLLALRSSRGQSSGSSFREWRWTEALYWTSFLALLGIRAWNPEIFWGEKPMDFSLLNSLYRANDLPPPDPWFAGSTLRYNYFGHFSVAALGRLCWLHPALAFNYGVAWIGAGVFTAAFAAGYGVAGERSTGLWASALVGLAGNLAGVKEVLVRRAVDFDFFWATSRVIPGTINEFPWWSLIFADLHAHVLALPLALSFLALLVRYVQANDGARLRLLPLLALTLGGTAVTSGWSAPTYLLLPAVVLALVDTDVDKSGSSALVKQWARAVGQAALLGTMAFILYSPMWGEIAVPAGRWGLQDTGFASIGELLTIFGLPAFVALFVLMVEGRPRGFRTGLLIAAAVLFALSLPAVSQLVPFAAAGVGWARLGLVALLAIFVALARDRALDRVTRLSASLFAFGLLVIAGTESGYVWDRMNTVFKFQLDAWLVLSLACAMVLPRLWSRWSTGGGPGKLWRACFVALCLAALLTSGAGAIAVLSTQRVAGLRPTLDGTAYLARQSPFEAGAIEWLNRNVAGSPVLAEAHGESYGPYSRVSMHTGLPTVLGWDYHVYQRGHGWGEIERRKRELESLYRADDRAALEDAVRRHGIELIFFGELERAAYAAGDPGLSPAWRGLLMPVYRNPGVTIYAVNRP